MKRTVKAAAMMSAVLLTLPAMLAGTVAGPAQAQPSNAAEPPPAAAVTLGWRALGVNSEVFLGPDSPTTTTLPVPEGLTAVRLQGMMHAPMNIDGGYLEIDDSDGKLLGTVDLPPAGAAQAMTPLDVDISAARTRASTVDLSLTLRTSRSGDGFCGPLQQLTLSDMATVFSGIEPPATTIATFFPPVLQQVSIYVPTDADTAEQQSALSLVATLARLYHAQPLGIGVVAQPRGAAPPPAGQLARAIVVERGGPAGLTVESPGTPDAHMRISGSGDELSTQVSLLVNQLQTLVQTPASRIEQAGSVPVVSGDTLTFGQLKMSGKTDVLRTSTVSVGVDRSALGNGRVEGVQVHLLADYTPVPNDDAASVVIRTNNAVVYRSALNNSGRLDATFDVPSQDFTQYLNLDMALTYTPHQTCGPLIAPITFQIDPQSTLTLRRGGPPLAGFGALPSEFSPSFMVAFDGSSPDQLIYAARTISAIARLTNQQLAPKVVDLKTAVDGDSGALIVANSAAIAKTSLNPPVGGDGTAIDVRLPTELRADITDGLGSIQAFADRPHNRSVVLITTTASWSLVDPLLNYIEGLRGGWSELTGDVLAAGAAGVPTNVAIRADSDRSPQAVAMQTSESSNRWVPIVVVVAVVVALALVAAALWSRRRKPARAGAHTAENSVDRGTDGT
ncbi:hypothetical protein Mycch_1276 [Mycolicibacterium chubuense NBB4]|uniref:Cellulose synthase subunit n=1 Tax=Mycolicibacterium chubuense (strain NBB4) TaxID=710421 RepID=I4BFM6_MYCCN|nr:hypothetical protein [Mycolicibacterium chubuense]AFM16083.1 hypothetical protein Mycch_1276 [Mycolicibacterium chubuense NBB4]